MAASYGFERMKDMEQTTQKSHPPSHPMELVALQAAKQPAAGAEALAEAAAFEQLVRRLEAADAAEAKEKCGVLKGVSVKKVRLGSLPGFSRTNPGSRVISIDGGKKRRKRKTVKKLKKRKLKAGKSKKARISLNSITRRARSLRYRTRYNSGSTRTIRTKKR